KFWSHSLMMAIAAQELGKLNRVCPSDELFACGLMARIGCLALATIYPTQYSELIEKETQYTSLLELEQQSLQTDHNEVTAAMLINFGVPNILVEPVYYHEMPAESSFSEGSRPYQIVHLFNMAKQIADFGIASESERNKHISGLILLGGKISLDTESFGNLIDQVIQEWQSWGQLLKISASQLPPFQKMMNVSAPRVEHAVEASSLRVLLVEDDPSSLVLAEGLLSNVMGHTVYTASDGKQALSVSMEVLPHIVVTDWIMPVMDGLQLTQSLRATDWGKNLYIIMLTSLEDEEGIIEAFDAGVDDYVTKPINIRAFRARLRAAWHYRTLQESWERDREQLKHFAAELAVTNRKLEHIALTDMLTEIPNRRAGMNMLAETWSISERSGHPMAVLLIDIDHFKKVNDTYGHAIGDEVLKEVAGSINTTARNSDRFCRMGGEEFLVICPSANTTDKKSTALFAERLRRQIKAQKIKIDKLHFQVTISVGAAVKTANIETPDQLINAADKALYAAKDLGRDRICLSFENKIISCKPQ
ncbi:MAG: diguanylate cyclase, partial [Betaproteobacteria bacterium]|nr:diguanylate cyclase [Betaproteobacteria bacterium]